MTLRSFRRCHPFQMGYSLVEMLVAVMLIAILTAGMLRIYSSNLAGFQRVNDIIGNERRGRWALASLQDDASSIGYFAFVPVNRPPAYSVGSGVQEPFMILPSPTPISITGPDPSNPGGALVTSALSPNPDELQFVGDLPLSIQAEIASPPTPTSLPLNVRSGSLSDVQPGDIVAVLDDGFEQFKVASVSSSAIAVSPAGQVEESGTRAGGLSLVASLSTAHRPGTPVAIYRPNVATRYAIQPRSWDPANPGITVPCLVRQRTPYPESGVLIDWSAVPGEVIAENIIGFRVDLSFDGGTTWLRTGSGNWDAIAAKIADLKLAPGGGGIPVRDPSAPLWFRNYPFMIRMDVTSRSAAPRSENSEIAGQAAYVLRSQTLMVTPRNFGLPL